MGGKSLCASEMATRILRAKKKVTGKWTGGKVPSENWGWHREDIRPSVRRLCEGLHSIPRSERHTPTPYDPDDDDHALSDPEVLEKLRRMDSTIDIELRIREANAPPKREPAREEAKAPDPPVNIVRVEGTPPPPPELKFVHLKDDTTPSLKPYPPGCLPPEGGLLNEEQQDLANTMVNKRVVQNEAYLAAHPEVEAIVELILQSLIVRQPADVRRYVNSLFSDPNIEQRVKNYMKKQKIDTSPYIHTRVKARSGLDTLSEVFKVGKGFEWQQSPLDLLDDTLPPSPGSLSEDFPYGYLDPSDLSVRPESEESAEEDSCRLNDFDSLTEVCEIDASWDK
ncbi:hypothetical protein AAG570_010174 [Ranatra chinensis]|uniref:Uncharacterized protein n=1 Tax=Ranatra chinensis TaxID=642074 RepID=A0ABD0YZZ1_9HEMI